jgi:hypothetical protein
MKIALAALAVIGVLGASLLTPAPAEARFFGGHALEAPSLVETVQRCRTRTVRTVRNGRVTVRTVRDCGPRRNLRRSVPGFRGCRTVRVRTVRPGGRVVFRSVRRC